MRMVLLCPFIIMSSVAVGQTAYQNTESFSPNDYLLGSYGKREDSVFDRYETIDLSIELGIGSDCGQIDFKQTMRAALGNVLDSKYMASVGRNIMAASPMLAVCYLSPTWCAILKSSQFRASLLANMRLDQCGMIDKYVDTRVEDYQQERQRCVRKNIKKSNGDFEQAMESCGDNSYEVDIANWAGGEKSKENRLLDSSADWSGFSGKEADRVLSLVKSLVGDTVISKGKVSVDFGPTAKPVTPRTYLAGLQTETYKNLCQVMIAKVQRNGGTRANIDRVITDEDIRKISGNSDDDLIDRQTIVSLAYMPYKKRLRGCRKLADAIAMTVFTTDMSRSLDFLSSRVVTNPNLPEHRKLEAERKRRNLKDQIEMSLVLHRAKNAPLNQVLVQINSEGLKYQDQAARRNLAIGESIHNNDHGDAIFMDCADGILCAY